MIIAACIDDNYGMMFNGRRQSQDRLVREDILKEAENARLWMNSYSAKQFSAGSGRILTDEYFMDKAAQQDFCFIENISAKKYETRTDKILLYAWNRTYPADFYFDLSLAKDWILIKEIDFKGYSHELIKKSIYVHSKKE